MEILQQIASWLLGILAIFFLIMSFVSIFMHGSTLFWVSEKANEKLHLFLFLAMLSFAFWFIVSVPDKTLEGVFCILPLVIFISAFSYGTSKFNRKFANWIATKTNVNPKDPFRRKE
jgi:hypothetical protein